MSLRRCTESLLKRRHKIFGDEVDVELAPWPVRFGPTTDENCTVSMSMSVSIVSFCSAESRSVSILRLVCLITRKQLRVFSSFLGNCQNSVLDHGEDPVELHEVGPATEKAPRAPERVQPATGHSMVM